jgi:hypothetical protein
VIRFAANDPEAVCGGTLGWMDDRVVALKAVFGEKTYAHIDYYWVPDLWPGQPWCREPASGCAAEDRVYSEHVPHEHEVIHALRRDDLPAVFEEGLAEMFGDIGWTREPASRARLLEILESGDPIDNADYSRASHFVAFLIESHGMERLDQLASLGDYHDSYSEVQSNFADAFGLSLDQALADYSDFPECDPAAWMDKRIACAAPATLLEPSFEAGSEIVLDFECGSAEVLGPHSGFMFTETTLDVAPQVDGLPLWIDLVGDISPEASAVLVSCGGCEDSTVVWLSDGVGYQQLELPAGRYVLRMFRPVDDPGPLGISLSY